MFNTNYEDQIREAREELHRSHEDYEARMEMFDAGRVSYGAAFAGGDAYTIEMRESAAVDELVAEPIAAALNSWARAVAIARKAA